ncbi:hypothetical protein DQ238_08410 [Geodermatophilus sp. TF02-6]|uniref:erythromycin esterase family protein n=1 Tax=Geodermatophilus sp. TF02-6 TaxID=2250575 RepID=UPI000DEB238C|nr:erythromycin esterase family protein [Geodermatophilus sp. TF02-6]RBY80590.1 hypothetical protein DQ238_08410 [Geodermatophilus sp. TF02-6]
MTGLRDLARPLRDEADLDPLLERVGDARTVAVGEASHGGRTASSPPLASSGRDPEGGREGDWPDCYRVNRSVKLRPGADADPYDVLDAFARWPTWMWANDDVVLVGFGGYRGMVVAGSEWGAQMQRMAVPEARAGSLEALLHEQVGEDALLVLPRGDRPAALDRQLDHRAIGVVYRPERERWGNYVPTVLAERYDAFLYFDDTRPLQPLHLERADEHVPPLAHTV